MNNDDLELKVCKGCDAPLPYLPLSKSYFKKNDNICDDCIRFKNNYGKSNR